MLRPTLSEVAQWNYTMPGTTARYRSTAPRLMFGRPPSAAACKPSRSLSSGARFARPNGPHCVGAHGGCPCRVTAAKRGHPIVFGPARSPRSPANASRIRGMRSQGSRTVRTLGTRASRRLPPSPATHILLATPVNTRSDSIPDAGPLAVVSSDASGAIAGAAAVDDLR
jgi:hypothetical protein